MMKPSVNKKSMVPKIPDGALLMIFRILDLSLDPGVRVFDGKDGFP